MWRLVLTVSLLCCSSDGSVTCKDKDGREVDWYILYKTPRNPQLTGLDYIYIYPDAKVGVTFQRNDQNKNIASPKGVLANTLQPLFNLSQNNPPQDFGFISYNDGVPKGYSASASVDSKSKSGGSAPSSFGHSKGVVMVQKDNTVNTGGTGVWLLHSTPKFPYKRDKDHFWPESGARNAQTFICVTFNYNQFKHIGEHLQRIRAFPFESHIPQGFHAELEEAKNKQQRNYNTLTNNQLFPAELKQLKSSEGKEFYSIAKQVSADGKPEVGDLYYSIAVNQKVDSDVYVQTWGGQDGRDVVSFCPTNGKKVENIKSVKTGLGKWDPGNDHSKWCVAVDQNKPWTCIADVNRSESQYKRLGGALCVKDAEIYGIFKNFVQDVEKCQKRRGSDPDTGVKKKTLRNG